MKTCRGGGNTGIAPLIRNLATRRRWLVNVTLWPLYPQDESSGWWLNSTAGLRFSQKRKSLSPCWNETEDPSLHSSVTILTELSKLRIVWTKWHVSEDGATYIRGRNEAAESCIINPLNPELNHICYLLALLPHHFLHVSRIKVKSLTLRLLMSYIYIHIYIYIYGAPILDVSRPHTTTQHSR